MNKYFFSVYDSETFTDEIGTVLPNLAEVRAHAIRTALEVLDFRPGKENRWRMEVTDQDGDSVFRLSFEIEDHATVEADRD